MEFACQRRSACWKVKGASAWQSIAFLVPPSDSTDMCRIRLSLLTWSLLSVSAFSEPIISEFMAQNNTGLRDENLNAVDWIEIHNPDAKDIDLAGYALTDSKDDLEKWKFPAVTIPAGGYLLVFASGIEREIAPPPKDPKRRRLLEWGISEEFIESMSEERVNEILEKLERRQRRVTLPKKRLPRLHVPFKLDGKGEYLALVKPDGKTICHAYAPEYPDQHDDLSYGRIKMTDEEGFLLEATPGKANGEKLLGVVKPLFLSEKGGHFDKPFELVIETSTPGAEIRYTLSGDEPTVEAGTVYSAPLTISKTTTLRVAAFKPKHRGTEVLTRTFLFLDDIVTTPDNQAPPGWPRGNANRQRMDYGMDPEIVGQEHTVAEVKAALEALPSLSIVAPLDSLFGQRNGIYSNAQQRGREWERASSVELLNHDGSKGFQVNGGLRARGGFSRQGRNPKHGFRMIFRKEYGDGKLKYPLFEDEGVEEFDKIDFRSSMNYSWAFDGGSGNTLLRDVWSRDSQRDMEQPYSRSRFYHLYLNGHYWGIYMTQERTDANYGAAYFGGKKEDYDTVKTRGDVTDGNGNARSRLYQVARKGFRDDRDYFNVQGMNPDGSRNPEFERLVDVDNVIDYMLVTFYTGDKDGPGGIFMTGNNYFSLYNRENPDGFKYFEHDSEHSLGLGQDDMTASFMPDDRRGRSSNIGQNQFNVHWLHTRLVENAHYLERFTERTEKHLFGDGALSPKASLARLEARKSKIDQAIIAHSARWGDANAGNPRTRKTWLRAVERIEDFMITRNETLLQQLHGRGWYQGLPTPSLTRRSGAVSQGAKIFVEHGDGDVYVTTDGSDPQGANGKPAPAAKLARIPTIDGEVLLRDRAMARAMVPRNGQLKLSWIQPGFDDSNWRAGRTALGFEGKNGYEEFLGIDVFDQMRGNELTSAYLRVPFVLKKEATSGFDELSLGMRYDDGFVAYLNGEKVASANAPARPQWNSAAVTDHPDDEAVAFVSFPLDEASGLLREGKNVLAIHGMDGEASSDFLISPQIEGLRYSGAEPISLKPKGTTRVRVRSLKDGKWSPLTEAIFTVE